MDQHESQQKVKERHQTHRRRRAHAHEQQKDWPVHPAWIAVLGVVGTLTALVVWTFGG